MSVSQFSTPYARYVPAELQHHAKSNGWLIVYRAFNPVSDELELVRVRLNRLRKKCTSQSQFKKLALQMVADLNVKLHGGWSPFLKSDVSARMYEPLSNAVDKYLADRAKELRGDTLRTYNGAINLLMKWLGSRAPQCRCADFTDVFAIEFMEYRLDKGISARTYNGNLKVYNAFCIWCKKHKYMIENPFETISERREEEKQRDVIPLEDLTKIRRYFEENCPGYVLVMLLVYFGGLRPKEITRVRVNQVHAAYRSIYMPGCHTKSHASRKSPLSTEMIAFLSSYLEGSSPDDYLIGIDYVPGQEPCSVKSMERRWRNMRERLGLPKDYQLYSLRDCSAYYRMESAKLGPLDTMRGLGHKQLSQTMVYADHEVHDLAVRLEDGTPVF